MVVKVYVYRNLEDSVPSATGHAYEKEGSSFINKTSALENCESSSVRRALALLRFEIKKSIAIYEEVANAKLNQSTKPTPQMNTSSFPSESITEPQKKKLYVVIRETAKTKGISEEELKKTIFDKMNVIGIDFLSKQQASKVIEFLQQ
ncbi:hypothetical protein [Pseudoneobacillus sp. C159]